MKTTPQYRYHTFQNLSYLFAGALRWQPIIIFCLILWAVTEGLKGFVWIYGGKLLIQIMEQSNVGGHHFPDMIRIILIAAGIELLFFLGLEVSRTTASSRIIDVRCRLALFTNKKAMTVAYSLLEEPQFYSDKRKGDKGTAEMSQGVEGMLRETAGLGAHFITMVTAAIILWGLNPWLALIMLVLAVIRGILHDRTWQWEKKEIHDPLIPKQNEHYYYLRTAADFSYAKDIRIFRMKKAIGEKQAKLLAEIRTPLEKLNRRWRNTLLREEGIGLLQEGLMYLWLLYAVLRQGMSVADFTLYVGSIRSFNNAIGFFLQKWSYVSACSRQVCDFRNFLDYPDQLGGEFVKSNFRRDYQIFTGKNMSRKVTVPIPPDENYEVRFENVSFTYSGSKQPALTNLNLTLPPGRRLAVVGLNGAGKSTFIKLLCGLYQPTAGRIFLNGQDIRQFDKEEYFKLIAPVFQNVECFAASLGENVSMRNERETAREKVLFYLEKAGLGEKIKSLEKGIDTELLKNLKMEGIELSGGEKQKLALARALHKNAPIVILDEPTAALDALAEYQTYRDFDRLIGEKTAVYISHRLSSTRFCHNVAMFEAGKMVEYGTHESLLAAGKGYAKMFEVQARYYREDGDSAYA